MQAKGKNPHTMKEQTQHEESGCTDYLQHNAENSPRMTAAPMKTKEKQIERTAEDHRRFQNDMQRIEKSLARNTDSGETKTSGDRPMEVYRSAPPGLPPKEWHFPLSKGESAHTLKHPELITADMLGAGHLECAEAIEHLTAERDRLREQVKELLAICKALAARGAVIATTGLGDKLNATIKHVESASVEADKQGGQQS